MTELNENYDLGYIYCFSNPSYSSDILKVGMTNRTPDERAKELYTTGLPTPFIIEFAKKVNNPKDKEKIIHKILDEYRVNPKREFFRVSIEKVKMIFELPDGEWWSENSSINDDEATEEDEDEDESPVVRKKRDMTKCFSDGQIIKHTIGDSTRIGTYVLSRNVIEYNGIDFKSPSGFTSNHYRYVRPDRTDSSNGWSECTYELNGEWISISTLYGNKL